MRIEYPQKHKVSICMSLIAFIAVFMVVSVLSLPYHATAQKKEADEYWRGKVDEKLNETEKWHEEVKGRLESIHKDIKDICSDITEIKIKAAQSGAMYGAGAGLATYIIALMGQLLKGYMRKRNGPKR